eukprot:1151913-Pelagomonas_calceolata.AAC.8
MVNALLAGRPWRTQCGLLRRASLALAQHRSFSPLPETTSAEKAIEAAAAQPGQGENQPRHVARWFPGAALRQFGRDLTDQARRGLLDPVIGREAIVQRALQEAHAPPARLAAAGHPQACKEQPMLDRRCRSGQDCHCGGHSAAHGLPTSAFGVRPI